MSSSLPEDSEERNGIPMADGLLYYFPNALAEIAKVSKAGNDQHNPGQPLHWSRWKSTDHANKIMRHLVDAGKKDNKGIRHSAYMAWRALALLQEELEQQEGYPLPRSARLKEEEKNDGQTSTNPVPTGDSAQQVFPMGREHGEAGNVGGNGWEVYDLRRGPPILCGDRVILRD